MCRQIVSSLKRVVALTIRLWFVRGWPTISDPVPKKGQVCEASFCRTDLQILCAGAWAAVSRRLPVPFFQVRASIGRRVNSISVCGAGLTWRHRILACERLANEFRSCSEAGPSSRGIVLRDRFAHFICGRSSQAFLAPLARTSRVCPSPSFNQF